jgi:hypothetical protein
VVLAAVALSASAGTVRLATAPAPTTVSVDRVVAAFAAEGIHLDVAGQTARGTVFLSEEAGRDGRFGLLVVVAGRRSEVEGVLTRAPLPPSTGLVRFSEFDTANVTVRSGFWRPGGAGDAPVRAAVARLR